jgi:hypothetical protein
MKGTFGEITTASENFNKSIKDRGGLIGKVKVVQDLLLRLALG